MKKLKIIFITIVLVGVGIGVFIVGRNVLEAKRIEEIKKGWHVEIINEYINVRKDADRNSSILAEVKQGEVYKTDEYINNNGNFWYHIEYEKNKWGWVANPIGKEYLKDNNNEDDIKSPTIRFEDAVYYANSIDEISYDHLEVTDDKPGVTITHKVYHEVNLEENKDQYWILYIATDKVGKVTKKVQKIEFNIRPDEEDVLDFINLAEDRK